MQYITSINNQKCLEWGINATQGALFSLLYEANSWATEIIKNEKTYYFVSRNLIIQELPLFFDKADTVYRNLKALEKVGLIEYIKSEKKDLIRITEKGKTWNYLKSEKEAKNSEINPNSEIFPKKLGNKSEKEAKNSEINPNSEIFPKKLGNKSEKEAKNSEINPTNQDINIYQDTSNQLKEKNKKERNEIDDYINAAQKSEEYKNLLFEFVKYRKRIKLSLKTPGPLKTLINFFPTEELLREALEYMDMYNWRTAEPQWIENKKQGGNNNGRKCAGYSKTNGKHSEKPDYSTGFEDWN